MSGGSDKAANAANAAEQDRLGQIRNTQSRVNATFDAPGRKADIADYVDATRQYQTDDLTRQKAESDRGLRFALARGGQIGGSVNVDKQAEQGRLFNRGLLAVEGKAQGAGAALEAQDQDARARLISLATSGLDATTGASQAAAAMKTNLEAGKAGMRADTIGNAFGSIADFTKEARRAAEQRRANKDSGFDIYNPGRGYGE